MPAHDCLARNPESTKDHRALVRGENNDPSGEVGCLGELEPPARVLRCQVIEGEATGSLGGLVPYGEIEPRIRSVPPLIEAEDPEVRYLAEVAFVLRLG